MKQYKVEITKEALQDMEDIYNYIAMQLVRLWHLERGINEAI